MDRPKRTRHATAKAEASTNTNTSAAVIVVQPRKKKTITPEDQLETLLKSPKSGLTTRDMPVGAFAGLYSFVPSVRVNLKNGLTGYNQRKLLGYVV